MVDTDAFAAFSPAPQAFGDAGVGIMRGPGYVNFDFTLAKNFTLDERRYIQFRIEVFNAFNHANFGPPSIARDATTFGQISTAGPARIIQFGVKLLLLTRHFTARAPARPGSTCLGAHEPPRP